MRRRRGWMRSLFVVLVVGLVGAPWRSARGEPGQPAAIADSGASPAPARLDLNTATVEQLDGLPGVGRKRAEAIVARRAAKPFQRVTELLRVKGFGPKSFGRVRPFVAVGPVTTP